MGFWRSTSSSACLLAAFVDGVWSSSATHKIELLSINLLYTRLRSWNVQTTRQPQFVLWHGPVLESWPDRGNESGSRTAWQGPNHVANASLTHPQLLVAHRLVLKSEPTLWTLLFVITWGSYQQTQWLLCCVPRIERPSASQASMPDLEALLKDIAGELAATQSLTAVSSASTWKA